MAGWGGTSEETSGGGDAGTGPSVENYSPAAGTSIKRNRALSFDIHYNGATLAALTISVIYGESNVSETIYTADEFTENFKSSDGFIGSERQLLEGDTGLHFIIRRRSGWPFAPTPRIEGADVSGNPITGG